MVIGGLNVYPYVAGLPVDSKSFAEREGEFRDIKKAIDYGSKMS